MKPIHNTITRRSIANRHPKHVSFSLFIFYGPCDSVVSICSLFLRFVLFVASAADSQIQRQPNVACSQRASIGFVSISLFYCRLTFATSSPLAGSVRSCYSFTFFFTCYTYACGLFARDSLHSQGRRQINTSNRLNEIKHICARLRIENTTMKQSRFNGAARNKVIVHFHRFRCLSYPMHAVCLYCSVVVCCPIHSFTLWRKLFECVHAELIWSWCSCWSIVSFVIVDDVDEVDSVLSLCFNDFGF